MARKTWQRREPEPDPPAIRMAWRGGHGGRPGWFLSLGFSPPVIERLTAAVPPRDRAWNGQTQCWWVRVDYEETLGELLPRFWAHQAQGQLL